MLFGLDDGARTLEESLAMVRMAAEHGTTDLVATPHANLNFKFDPERIAERLAQIREAAGGALRLYTGCDFHLSFDNIQDSIEHPRKYTVNQQRYLLVEFSDLLIFKNTEDIFARLRDAGMTPIVTHPERNGLIAAARGRPSPGGWIRARACKLTAQSLTGAFGRRAQEFSRELLDRRLVHVVASDGHDCEQRPPVMDQAHAWLREEVRRRSGRSPVRHQSGRGAGRETKCICQLRIRNSSVRKWYEFWR